MGILVRYDREGNAHPMEFSGIDEFHEALKDCLEKMAGPRKDGKLSQLEYVAEKAAAIENGLKQGIMSTNGAVRQVRRMKVIFLDIARDLQYARRYLENINGGNEEGRPLRDGCEAGSSGRSMVQVLSEGGSHTEV